MWTEYKILYFVLLFANLSGMHADTRSTWQCVGSESPLTGFACINQFAFPHLNCLHVWLVGPCLWIWLPASGLSVPGFEINTSLLKSEKDTTLSRAIEFLKKRESLSGTFRTSWERVFAKVIPLSGVCSC